jgi:MASE1
VARFTSSQLTHATCDARSRHAHCCCQTRGQVLDSMQSCQARRPDMDHPSPPPSRRSDHVIWMDEFRRLASSAPLQVVLVAASYYVTGRLGLALAVPPGYATAVWPPSGIALAAILLCGNRVWPGIVLGSFCINVETGFDAGTPAALATSLAVPGVIAGGAALQAVAGGFLVRRFLGFPCGLVEVGQVARLLTFGGIVPCTRSTRPWRFVCSS